MNYFDYIEEAPHGTPDFPLAYYYVDENHVNYEMPFHWHRELEISYILKGSYTFYLNEKVITAKEGDVVFIAPGIIHGGKPDNCVYECVVFNPNPFLPSMEACKKHITDLISSDTWIDPVFPAGHPVCEVTRQLMEAIRMPSEIIELNILTQMYHWFMTIHETESYTKIEQNAIPDAQKMQVLKPVLTYIDEHYMQPITLEELAGLADMSVSHFCRYFKSLIHKSPIDYLIYYRVERACYLFATTQMTLMEVMYQCGFNDSSYFIHIFKKHKGITPKKYKKQYQ